MWIDDVARVVHLDLVYAGTPLAGRLTSLQYIYNKTRPEAEKLIRVDQGEHGRIFRVEFTPRSIVPLPDHRLRLHLRSEPNYCVTPPANFVDPVREVLRGADGLIFVADSHPYRDEPNQGYLEELDQLLRDQGDDPAVLPRVYFYNKRDYPEAMAIETMNATLNPEGRLNFPGIATQGVGVFETLQAAVKQVLAHAKANGSLK